MAEAGIRKDAAEDEVERLRAALERQCRLAEEKERQLERYASDLRETFKAERARTDELTRRMAPQLAEDPQVEFGFLLHDVGKVAISDGILFKPEPLLPEERTLMRRHPMIGYEIVRTIPFLADAAQIVRHHHERWDGAGYPDGLAAEQIPVSARIFSVVDALDAMTTDRPFSPSVSFAHARSEIAAKAGSQFDPAVAEELTLVPDSTLEDIRAEIT
jgi:HD-GYP domain-containing protein (c-di-GMP phosphodiesterase class II)